MYILLFICFTLYKINMNLFWQISLNRIYLYLEAHINEFLIYIYSRNIVLLYTY